MNTPIRKRGLLAGLGAMVAVAALALGGTAATAAPLDAVPDSVPVVIDKRSQPATLGDPATGEEIQSPPGTGIGGVIFEYYLVTGTGAGQANDIGTEVGQAYAGTLTAATAPIPGTATGSFPATNTAAPIGQTTATLPRGLYVVKESVTPAGVTPAADFLLAVPLTDPTNLDEWLSTIYVYPKNAQVEATKSVNDAASLVVGSDVTWTIETEIPRNPNPAGTPAFVAPDAFEIHDTLTDSELLLSTAATNPIVVTAGGTTLDEGTHYTVTPVAGTGTTTYEIVFTQPGRQALADAVNADTAATVTVQLVTTVQSAVVIGNQASIYTDQKSIDEDTPLVTDEVESKYGSYRIVKESSDATVTDLSGAQFRVYATEAAALAGGNDYLTPTDNTGVVQSIWTTDTDGTVTIQGLRYSGWANGGVVNVGDAGYQSYWLVEVTALEGHQLFPEPIEIVIDDASVTQTSQTIVNQANEGGFVLPLTGGMGTAILTIGGVAILATVILLARRRSRSDDTVAAA